MLALLPLLLSVAPELVRWIAGDAAGTVATKAVQVAGAVLGTTDPTEAAAAVQDPAKALELRLALAKVAADAEAAKRQAELDTLKASLSDVANARAQTMSLAATSSPMAWGAPVVSFIVLGALAVLATVVVIRPLPAGSETLVAALLETLKVLAVSVVAYWVGSSAGSARKDATIAAVSAAPTPPAVAVVNQPSGTVNTGSTTDDINAASLRSARGG